MVFCSGVSVVIRFCIIRSVLRKCGLLKCYVPRIIGCNSLILCSHLCLVVSFHKKSLRLRASFIIYV